MRKIAAAPTPGKAKGLGRRKTWKGKPFLRADWDNLKLDLIYRLLQRKFAIPELRARLLATGDRQLIELNTWNDTTWGVVPKAEMIFGSNLLGQMLMKLRAEIRAEAATAA